MGTRDIFLSEEDYKFLNEKVNALVKSVGARCGLLVDKSGYLIIARGKFHYIPADDIGVMSAAAFSALCNMVDVAAAHISVDFHFPGAETMYFAVVNPQIYLILFYKTKDEKAADKKDEIMKKAQEFIREVKPVLGKRAVNVQGWGSLDFITEKLDQIFEDDDKKI